VNVGCSAANPSPVTVDSSNGVGQYTSITTGSDGLSLISYYDVTNHDLKVAHCDDTACTTATKSTLDSTGDVGKFTSITIGADGLGLIGYYDTTNASLKVAHCTILVCSSATTATPEGGGGVAGQYTGIGVQKALAQWATLRSPVK